MNKDIENVLNLLFYGTKLPDTVFGWKQSESTDQLKWNYFEEYSECALY